MRKTLSASEPVKDKQDPPSRKPPIWPWVVLLVVVLLGIYAHHELSLMIEDLQRTGRDFVQLFEWLLSFIPEQRISTPSRTTTSTLIPREWIVAASG